MRLGLQQLEQEPDLHRPRSHPHTRVLQRHYGANQAVPRRHRGTVSRQQKYRCHFQQLVRECDEGVFLASGGLVAVGGERVPVQDGRRGVDEVDLAGEPRVAGERAGGDGDVHEQRGRRGR